MAAPLPDDSPPAATTTNPPDFDVDELVACARYDDLPELESLVSSYLALHPNTPLRTLYTSATATGATALHYAAANGHLDIVSHILPHLTVHDINKGNEDGSTALHWAALNGKKECVEMLVKAGADARVRNSAGRSAVTVAEQQGHSEVVMVLLGSFDPEEEEEGEEEEGGEGEAGESTVREGEAVGEEKELGAPRDSNQ